MCDKKNRSEKITTFIPTPNDSLFPRNHPKISSKIRQKSSKFPEKNRQKTGQNRQKIRAKNNLEIRENRQKIQEKIIKNHGNKLSINYGGQTKKIVKENLDEILIKTV